MKKLNKNSKYIKTRMKHYYSGMAFIILMFAPTLSQAMDPEISQDKKILFKVRTLWELGKKEHRIAALESLEKKLSKEESKNNIKLRLEYFKRLSEFLKEHPAEPLKLTIVELPKEPEESQLSIFYMDTLKYIQQSASKDKDFHTLKAKTFYHHFLKYRENVDSESLIKDINSSYLKLLRNPEIDKNKLNYFKFRYISPDRDKLQDLLFSCHANSPLIGKINFILGHNVPQSNDEAKRVSQQEAFYKTSAQNKYSWAEYYLAELYSKKDMSTEKVYNPEQAYELYINAVSHKNHLAEYKLAKVLEEGDQSFGLLPDREDALRYKNDAASWGHPYAQYELAKDLMASDKYEEGLKLLRKSARSGYAKAQVDLGKIFVERTAVAPQDMNQAIFWYESAAFQNEEEAYFPLALIYEEGQQKYDKAIELYEKSPDSKAQVRLGMLYNEGKGTAKNTSLARKYFERAVEQNNIEGNYHSGLMSLRGIGLAQPELKDAFENFSLAAEGYPKAHFYLGLMKQFGIGTERDDVQAIAHYEISAKNHDADSMYNLSLIHKKGLGVEKNEENALNSLTTAADIGQLPACFRLGKHYCKKYLKNGGDQDLRLASLFLDKAAQKPGGDMDAYYLLGLLEEKAQAPMEAKNWFEKAAKSGHPSAAVKLGEFYELKDDPDFEQAFKYYLIAAVQNHIEGRQAVARCHLKGIGTSQNADGGFHYMELNANEIDFSVMSFMAQMVKAGSSKALQFFESKAEEGNTYAQYYYGKLKEAGIYTEQDITKAIDLYTQASQKYNRSATRRLADLKHSFVTEALGIKDVEILSPETKTEDDSHQ